MASDDPPTQELKLRQLSHERAEREQLAEADSGADAARHRRRADKAGYLRRKLEERERSEAEAEAEAEAEDEDEGPPPAA